MTLGLFASSVLRAGKGAKKLGSIIKKRSRSKDKIWLRVKPAMKYVKTIEEGNILNRKGQIEALRGIRAHKTAIGISPLKSNLQISKQFSRMSRSAKKKRYTKISSIMQPRIEKKGGILTSRKNYKTIMELSKQGKLLDKVQSKFLL